MKKMMFFLMMICLSANAWAQTSGNCGKENDADVTWSYDAATTTLTISGTGDMADFTSGAAPWNAYLSNITSVVIKSGVTSIGASAFAWCSALPSVSIPGSVTSIGNQAFYDCSDLTSVSIPSGVTSIGVQAFFNCPALTSVSIPTSVTSIGTRVFQGCSGLTTITVGASNATYRSTGGDGNECNAILSKDGKTLFAGCKTTTIPGGVTSIEDYAFYDCTGLTSVSIPSGVTSIGDQTFFGCSGLTSVSIPSGVTSIGSSAFSGCSGLTSVSIPSGVTSIGDYVFFGCTGLTSVSIPGGVTSIGVQAFRGCTGLTSVYYNTTSPITYDSNWNLGSTANPARILHIPAEATAAFTANGWTTDVFSSISADIPAGTCGTGVSWVLVDHTLTISGTGAMADFTSGAAPWNAYLSNITSVVIKSGVTSIGKYAFKDYLDLTSVSIPGGVTSIGSPAFLGCSGLTDVYYNTTSPITYDSNWNLGSTANPARILHIPAEATAAFTANGWTTDVFSSISADIPAGTCGTGVSWVLVDHTLTISGTGAMADFTSGAAPWNAYLSNITSVVIKSGVTSIGASAFAWCSALTSVSIPGSVTSIGNQAFYDCSDLTSVSIPSGVTSIGVQAFFNCPALTSVSIPTSVTSIGTRVFQGCSGLTTITVDASNATYRSTGGDGNECNAILSKDGKTLFAGCKTTTIPGGVTSIGDYAFRGCTGLTSVSIPSGVTSIGDQTFFGCSGLTSVSIPSGVTSIGSYAFSGCSGLTSVSIPGGVTSIGVQAFRGCTGLTSVYYNTTSPITYDSNWNLGSTANPARTLHIPSGQATTFSGKGWTTSVFASISEDIYSGTCGTNVSWVLVGHTLTISGAGAMADYNSENAPWSSYSSRITSVVIV